MKTVECVKLFLNQFGLNWNGYVCGPKEKDFREAQEEDFEQLETLYCAFKE